MKTIILAFVVVLFLAVSVSVWADPWLICDPAKSEDLVTTVIVTLDGAAQPAAPYDERDGVCYLMDLAGLSPGVHIVTAVFKNQWGQSVTSNPLQFTASIPGAVQNIGITESRP